MATVLLAEHERDQTRVALKIMRSEIVSDPSFIEAFGHEVRAAASLDHERITAVFDHGVITKEEAGSDTPLAGMPWLAMELVEGGTLADLAGRLAWPQLQTITMDVLDALAHAHARGMVHRDIKPGNVLIDARTGRVKLTDFGLVHSVDTDEGLDAGLGEMISGTPAYMAPEQIRCAWRDYGPSTDLYAVGAMVWTLATGHPPHLGSVHDILDQHLAGELPEFDPVFATPLALLDWIEVMMDVAPHRRFQRAADAAWALSRIGKAGTAMTEPRPQRGSSPDDQTYNFSGNLSLQTLMLDGDSTMALPDKTMAVSDDTMAFSMNHPSLEEPEPTDLEAVHPTPPLPSDWGRVRRERPLLHGAGLALFGLRASGIFGRYEERDLLWSALNHVKATGQTQLVLIDGASGSGKSTLAKWLCTRADEVGGARSLSVHDTKDGAESEGLSAMLKRALRLGGTGRSDAVERVRRLLTQASHRPIDDAVGLAHIAEPSAEVPEGSGLDVHFNSLHEKHALVLRYLGTLAKQRPLILWMDEFQYSSESQALIDALLNSTVDVPILVVGTVQAETIVSGSPLAETLAELNHHPRVQSISLNPLDRDGQIALVRDLLGLELSLATKLAAKAGGNPQFAVQLVSDWVAQGMLVAGPDGYVLANNAEVRIPADMLAVWLQRLDAVGNNHPPEAMHAIEMAALLGDTVNREEWNEALNNAGLPVPTGMLSELLRLRLIEREHQFADWSFVHGMFRAAVLHHAEQHQRTIAWSSVCADVVRTNIARKARLLVAANRNVDALHPLWEGVQDVLESGDWGRAKELGDLRTSILAGVAVDPDGPHALDTALTELYLRRGNEAPKQQMADIPDLIEWARKLERIETVVKLTEKLGSLLVSLGQRDDGRAYILSSLDMAREHRLKHLSRILSRLCFICIRSGELKQAGDYAREAGLSSESRGDMLGVANAYNMMARVQWQAQDLDNASFYLNEAAIRFERLGSMYGLAQVWNTRGELARARGDLNAAEVAYREAAARYDGCGNQTGSMFSKMNLGSTYVTGSKFAEARAILDSLEQTLEGSGRINILLVTQLIRINCFIHDNDWDRVERDLNRLAPLLDEQKLYDTDIASSARLSGLACDAKGRPDLGRSAWAIVHSQLTALGRTEEAAEAASKLTGSGHLNEDAAHNESPRTGGDQPS